MSTHHDIEHEQENTSPASPPPSPPNRRRFTVVVVTLVVVLLLALSIGIVTQLGQQHVTPGTPMPNPTTTTPVPTSTTQPTATPTSPSVPGQWVQVLTDYKVTSLAAAPSHPNVLYACVVPPRLPANMAGVQTVLRSADFGATWQDIGSRAQMSRGCELTINPTDSYEIYVVTSSNPPTDPSVPSYVLEHTANGGDTWETIHPIVHGPGLNITPAWRGWQLSFEGNRLYSLFPGFLPTSRSVGTYRGSEPILSSLI
jgi:hypothetical protein